MTKYWEVFFESYNSAIKTEYDAYLRSNPENGSDTDDSGSLLQEMLKKGYDRWLNTPLEALGEKTPAEFTDGISNFDEIAAVFSSGAVICDDELPQVYTDKLRSFGKQAVDFLIRTACGELPADVDDSFIPQVMAVRILGKWRAEEAVEPLIAVLADENEAYDLMCETVRDALIEIGSASIGVIAARLDSGPDLPETTAASLSTDPDLPETAKEYLLMALAEIGKTERSDKVYSILKKSFREMPGKSVAAACLAQYGDGRAIPLLRGYLERNSQNISRQTFYDIASAVKRLGGQTDDL